MPQDSTFDRSVGAARASKEVPREAVSPARIFWATWLGWMLDGFDATMYVYILSAAVTELLTREGRLVNTATVALYGGYFFTIFMLGWACSIFWGRLADRIGRVRVMCLTILTYSIFTGLCGLATNLLMFGIFRFLAGFGIGGEWTAGVTLLHESLPEHLRVKYAGWLHTATPTGITLAAGGSLLFPVLGWRGLFMVGAIPALLTIYVRRRIPEPEKWKHNTSHMEHALEKRHRPRGRAIFDIPIARAALMSGLMVACAIFGLWSTSYWAPTFVITKVVQDGGSREAAQRLASFAGLFGSAGTMVACLASPWLARVFRSRRATGTFFFAGALIFALLTYGYAAKAAELTAFLALLPLLGFFTNGVFALYSMWLPEMFPGAYRAFGAGFAFSFGRILGAAGPTIVGLLVGISGSYPSAIATASLIYVAGVPFTLLSPETADQPLRK